MRTAARSAGYGALLVAAFAAAWTAGALVRPAPAPAATPPTATHARAAATGPVTRPTPARRPVALPGRPLADRRPRGSPRWTATRSGSTVTSPWGLPRRCSSPSAATARRSPTWSPWTDAFGRLVALRAGDLVPAHVHPDATPPAPTDRAGPGIAFTVEVPGGGAYRLVLDFRHAGAVHTAVFTLPAG